MNQPRKPKKVKAPFNVEGKFTVGVEYECHYHVDNEAGKEFGYLFFLKDDKGETRTCLQRMDSHLDDQDWIVTEWEDENN